MPGQSICLTGAGTSHTHRRIFIRVRGLGSAETGRRHVPSETSSLSKQVVLSDPDAGPRRTSPCDGTYAGASVAIRDFCAPKAIRSVLPSVMAAAFGPRAPRNPRRGGATGRHVGDWNFRVLTSLGCVRLARKPTSFGITPQDGVQHGLAPTAHSGDVLNGCIPEYTRSCRERWSG